MRFHLAKGMIWKRVILMRLVKLTMSVLVKCISYSWQKVVKKEEMTGWHVQSLMGPFSTLVFRNIESRYYFLLWYLTDFYFMHPKDLFWQFFVCENYRIVELDFISLIINLPLQFCVSFIYFFVWRSYFKYRSWWR